MSKNIINVSKEFLRATQRNDLDRLKYLSEEYNIEDWTVYRHDVCGDTALHIAAREGYLHIVAYLCTNWAYPEFKIDVTNKDMKRPLHEASQFSRYEIVDFLIKQGASVDSLKRADWTPLMLACSKNGTGALECVINLIKAGADVMIRNKDGWIPLHIACRVGNISIIHALLMENPDSATTRTNNGRTSLHIAAFHGYNDVIQVLIEQYPELIEACDTSGFTPIYEAVKNKNFSTFQCLVEHNADLQKIDSIGQTILHVAVTVDNISVIDYLMKNKCINVNSQDNFGITPLNIAQRNKIDGNVIDLLIKYGAYLNT